MKKISVAIVSSVIDNRPAKGTALVARKFLDRLEKYQADFDFTLIHQDKTDDPLYQKWPELLYPAKKFPGPNMMPREIAFWLNARKAKKSFDIVHYLNHRLWPSYLLTNSKKVIVTAHDAGIMLDLYKRSLADYIFRFTNRWLHYRLNYIIAVSQTAKKEICQYYHVPETKVASIYNGIDLEQFQNVKITEQTRQYLNQKYGLPTNRYLLSVGRFDPHKNILNMIKAYDLLKTQQALVLLGGRHLPDYNQQVDELIKKLNLEKQIYISPYIEDIDLPAVYGAADLTIYPSLHEGFGLPLLESMACGTAVVAANTTSLPEISNGAAMLFDPLSPEDIASSIKKIQNSPELRQDLIQKGLIRVKDFSWDKMADEIIALYKK